MHTAKRVESRTSKSTNNILTGFLSQIIILILNFVVRYIFIQNLGYNYLGINSLFSSILTILSVADLGFGSALGIVLYSSLAKKNEQEIAGLMNFFKKVYLIVGLSVVGVGLAVTPFVKYLVNTDESIPYLSLYFLFFLANTVSSYFISYRAILIKADQRNSVVNNVTTIVKIVKALLEAFVLFLFPKWFGILPTYFSYLGIMVLATYGIGILTSIYAKKKYPYAFSKTKVDPEKKKDIITTTKDLLIYKLCSAFSSPIDSVLISLFVGTALLGIYSNYLLIFTTLLEFICLISRNIISSVGNFVVEKPIEDQKKLYFEIQALYFAIIVFCTINFVSLVSPFIGLVFHSESVLSNWVVYLFGFTLIVKCAGELSIIFRETTKIYRKTKYASLIYLNVHVGLSILFGYFFGLEGVLLGNVVAYFTTSFWFEIFALFKWHFKENPLKTFLLFLYVIAITAGVSFGSYVLCNNVIGNTVSDFVLACATSLGISLLSLLFLLPLPGFRKAASRVLDVVIRSFNSFYSKKFVQRILFISYFVVIIALLSLRDFFGIDINKFIFMGVFITFVILCKKQNSLMIILFTLPFSTSLAELYIQLFALIYLFIVCFKKQSWKRWIIIFSVPAFLFAYEMIVSIFYGGPSLETALRIFSLLSILGIIFYDRSEFTKKHLFAFIGGSLFTLFVIAINWVAPAIYSMTYKGSARFIPSLSLLLDNIRLGHSVTVWVGREADIIYPIVSPNQVAENPNNIGLIAIVCLATISAIYGQCIKREKILLSIAYVLLVFFGIWCRSRMFIIAILALFMVTAILFGITRRSGWITIVSLFVIFALAATVIFVTNPNVFQFIIDRFFTSNLETAGYRLVWIKEYFAFTFSDWKYALFGIGVHNLKTFTGIEDVPHTNFLQFISAYGIVLFVLFVAFTVFMWTRSKDLVKPNKPKILLCLPLLFAFIFTLSIQLFAPSIILICFIPGILCASYFNKNNEKMLWDKSKLNEGEKIKIAICSASFGGGMGTYLSNLIPNLLNDNFEVAIIYNPNTPKEEKEKFKDIKCHKFEFKKKISKFKSLHLIRKNRYYEKTLESFKPDIVYINTSSFARSKISYDAASSFYYGHIIIHSHNAVNKESKLSLFERWIRYNMVLDNANRYSCSLESGKVFYGKKFGTKYSDSVINNFIDIKRFSFDLEKREEIRKRYSIKDDDILLGSIGRLSEQKNQKYLLNLLVTLPEQYKLFIVGDGPLHDDLDRQIKDLKLDDRVKLIPSNNEVDKYLCALDYFCLPSLTEGLPFVSVEAQCSGVMNLINEDLSKEIAITKNVTMLPLQIDVWKESLKKIIPTSIEEREDAYKDIRTANYSIETAVPLINKKLKDIVYG